MWDLPGPGVKPLAGGFLTTDHPHPQARPCLIHVNLALIPIHKDTDVRNLFIILPDSFLPHFHYFIVSRCSSGTYKLLNNTHKPLSRSIIFERAASFVKSDRHMFQRSPDAVSPSIPTLDQCDDAIFCICTTDRLCVANTCLGAFYHPQDVALGFNIHPHDRLGSDSLFLQFPQVSRVWK